MKLHKTTLKNGIRLLTIPMPHVETVAALVLVGTGSEYESKKESGLSHFLEHMCFKGTTKRPTSQVLTHELDSIGADYNAYTGGTYTGYYAKAHKKHGNKIIDIISDIYVNSTFPETELQKEKNVIIEEINMREDNPRTKVGDTIDELMFGDTSLGRPIIGTKKTVNSFTREDLIAYHKKFYVPGATVVVVAGNVPKNVEKTVESLLGNMKKAPIQKKESVQLKKKGPAIKIMYKDTNQTQLIISFSTFNIFDKRVAVAHTLSTALGGGMSSRLFNKIREELGLCYGISCSFNAGIDHGSLTIRAGVGNDKVAEAIQAILHELRTIRDEGITEPELRKIKDYRLSGLVLGLETSDDYAEYCGFQELIKKTIKTPEESAKNIENVSVQQVQRVAKDILKEEAMYVALVGPHKTAQKLKSLLKLS